MTQPDHQADPPPEPEMTEGEKVYIELAAALTACMMAGHVLDGVAEKFTAVGERIDELTTRTSPQLSEGMPTQAETLEFVRQRWPDKVDPIWRASKCAEEAGECLGALNKPWLTAADLEKETAQLAICVMALAESAGFDLRKAVADEWERAVNRVWPSALADQGNE